MDEKAGKFGAFLPRSYLAESRWRMDGYRRIAESHITRKNSGKLRADWRDKYGPWPEAGRAAAAGHAGQDHRRAGAHSLVETQGEKLMLRQGQDYIMVSGKFPRLISSEPDF